MKNTPTTTLETPPSHETVPSHAVPKIARMPPPVRPGDLVGIAAISGPVDPHRLEVGRSALKNLGFAIAEADNLCLRHGLFAGSDAARLDAFHCLAENPEVRAIFFARGGHGALRLLPEFDWELLARYPRAYIGYSDLTPFLLQVVERLGLVAFHGPMVAADFARGLSGEEEQGLLKALAGELPLEFKVHCKMPQETIEGRLMGGCLSLLTAMLGTPYAPNLAESLLFLEDIGEPNYRLDRMLTHLHLSGSLASTQGMIVGHLNDSGEPMPQPYSIFEQWAEILSIPCALGLHAGHAAPNDTLPLGLWARLDPNKKRLIVGEPTLRGVATMNVP